MFIIAQEVSFFIKKSFITTSILKLVYAWIFLPIHPARQTRLLYKKNMFIKHHFEANTQKKCYERIDERGRRGKSKNCFDIGKAAAAAKKNESSTLTQKGGKSLATYYEAIYTRRRLRRCFASRAKSVSRTIDVEKLQRMNFDPFPPPL